MDDFRLPKNARLSSQTAIDRLFAQNGTSAALAYPLRAVWADNNDRSRGDAVQFLASVPKRRLRHAVDRVLMRRRIREAYRLNRQEFFPDTLQAPLDIMFVYIANSPEPYIKVENAMKKLLGKIFGR